MAFRLFGDFHWPPTVALSDDPDLRRGIIEIHFTAREGDPKESPLRALLRWYPTDKDTSPKQPGKLPNDHLFDLSPVEAVKWFKGP